MASSTPTQEKPIHSLILDTGPLIKNAVSISTLINTAEELYTTPAILSEIRDAATRSRVQTTLMPFLKVRTPSSASYDAVVAFSKKTGDHAVLSRQDLGILALAYEVHCERNGGNWGLREVPKGDIKRRPEEIEAENAKKAQKEAESAEQEKLDQGAADEGWSQPTKKRTRKRGAKKFDKLNDEAPEEVTEEAGLRPTEAVEPEVVEEGWEQPTGKKAAKARAPKPTKFKFEPAEETTPDPSQAQQENEQPVLNEAPDAEGGIAITQEQVQEQIQEQVLAQVQDQIHEQVQDQVHEQLENQGHEQIEEQAVKQAEEQIEKQVQEQVQEQLQHQVGEEGQIQQSAAVEVPSTHIHIEQKTELSIKPQQAEKSEQTTQDISLVELEHNEGLEQDMSGLDITQELTPPATDSSASDDDSDGDWITPTNLNEHQVKDSGLQPHIRTATTRQMNSAAMTTDFAMQNVLLQMNLNLLSTNMQRIKHVTTKVLRCHACFNIVKDMTKQFCPRCGQSTLQRVSCSTNAKGEFKIHLARNYQYNKRGDKYSIPKPIAGTANTKWSGLGGGKGGWGRDLILAEDQKEYQKQQEVEKRSKAKDLMDQDYLPGILTGDRGRAGGRLKVGAGKNVNSRKRV